MKNTKVISKLAVKMANSSLKGSANSTTCGLVYQPKAPAALKTFSKIENDQ